jgi:excisionase family DNA binding protein
MALSFNELPAAVETLIDMVKSMKRWIDNYEANSTTQSQWLNIDELCDYLPDRPAKKTIYKWVSDNTIPFYKGTKALRFHKPEIDNWLKEGKVETQQEIIAQLHNGGLLPIRKGRHYA